MREVLLEVFGLLAVAAGCGGDSSGVVSCTVSRWFGADEPPVMVCDEATTMTQRLRDDCAQTDIGVDGGVGTQAHFASGPCSRAGAAGGCTITAGEITVTGWYYKSANVTTADIMMECQQAGGTFVPP